MILPHSPKIDYFYPIKKGKIPLKSTYMAYGKKPESSVACSDE